MPVFALIDKKARGISSSEIDPVAQRSLHGRALQVRPGVAQDEAGRFALGIPFREEACEDAPEMKINVEGPEAEFRLQSVQRGVVLVRDQDIDPEPFGPSVRTGAETDRIRLFRN